MEDQTWLARSRKRRAFRCPACGARFLTTLAAFCPIDGVALVEASAEPEVDPLIGALLAGRYRVASLIGEGGMGKVYRVVDASGGDTVALKLLRAQVASDDVAVSRFVQEARIAANVRHEHLVEVLDFGEVEVGGARLPYFAMELLEGETLGDKLVRERKLDLSSTLDVFRQVSLGLGAVHRAGIVHRDLKPENVFLARGPDGAQRVKVLDFGVAKLHGGERKTRTGRVFGTPHYMSPEQASGEQVDARTDVYAVGVAMYEALTGRLPFSADTYMGVLTQHVFAAPEPIELVVDDPAALGGVGPVIMRCLEKRRDRRFASGEDLAAALEAVQRGEPPPLVEPVHPEPRSVPPHFAYATPASGRRAINKPALVVVAAVAMVAAAAVYFVTRPPIVAPLHPAAASPSSPSPGDTPRGDGSRGLASSANPSDPPLGEGARGLAAPSTPTTASTAGPSSVSGPPAPSARPRPPPSASARPQQVSDVVDPW